MKIIIIGAGLSGLSTAISLRKYIHHEKGIPLEVKVYDKTDHFDASSQQKDLARRRKLGAALNLQSNGLRVLEALDPELARKVSSVGFKFTHYKWKTAGGFLLGKEYADGMIVARPLLIDCLAETLPEGTIQFKDVSRVIARDGEKPIVQFRNGSPDEIADLVVGADGIGSIARQAIIPEDEVFAPKYLGNCGVGGVVNVLLPQHLLEDPCIVFMTGSTGVFGYCALTQTDRSKLVYFSFYETNLPARDKDVDREELVRNVRQRHRDWNDPLISKCLENTADDTNIYPIFMMPELPYWGKHGCVLVGDAAHAMPPRSGQGASQAFEDGQTLGLLLARHFDEYSADEAISKSVEDLDCIRRPRVDKIRAKALAWKDPDMPMSWWKTWFLYAFLFVNVKIRYLAWLWEAKDPWTAETAVSRYMGRKSTAQ